MYPAYPAVNDAAACDGAQFVPSWEQYKCILNIFIVSLVSQIAEVIELNEDIASNTEKLFVELKLPLKDQLYSVKHMVYFLAEFFCILYAKISAVEMCNTNKQCKHVTTPYSILYVAGPICRTTFGSVLVQS